MKERNSFLKIAVKLALALAIGTQLSTHADERAIPECHGLGGLPKLNISMDSLNSCADMDQDTFQDPTHDSYCLCQDKVFELIRNSSKASELSKERAYQLSSETFKSGFEEQIKIFTDIDNYESFYRLDTGSGLNCHLAQEAKSIAAACGKAEEVGSYIEKVLGDFDSKALSSLKPGGQAFDHLYGIQSKHMEKIAEVKPVSCMSPADGRKMMFATFEIFFENAREDILKKKDEFLSDPTVTLRNIFSDVNFQVKEAGVYGGILNDHPLISVLEKNPATAKTLIDWIEKHPTSKLSDIFNPNDISEISKVQAEIFQTRCQESLEGIKAGVKASVCGESAFTIPAGDPAIFASFAHNNVGEPNLQRTEALADLYCKSSSLEGEKDKFLITPIEKDITNLADVAGSLASEKICNALCISGQTSDANCDLPTYDDVAKRAKSSECSGKFSCLEIKALERVYEREEQKKRYQIAIGGDSSTPQSTYSRILIDQGVSKDVVAQAVSEDIPSRVSATKKSVAKNSSPDSSGSSLTSSSIPKAKPTKADVVKDDSQDYSIQDSLEALGAFGEQKSKNQIELDPTSFTEAKKSTGNQDTSDLVADLQARKRDQEIKKLRSAIADLEKMGGQTREDINSINNPQIPYHRPSQVGEDLGSGDLTDNLSYSPAYASRSNNGSVIPYPNFRPQNYDQQDGNLINKDRPDSVGTPTTASSVGAQDQAASANLVASQTAESPASGRAPASVAGANGAGVQASENATVKLSYQASELDTLGLEKLENAGISDKNEFLLEVLLSSGKEKVLIPVHKKVDESGKTIWEPQMTSANKDYFERVLEIPLFKDFKRDLIQKHFNQASAL